MENRLRPYLIGLMLLLFSVPAYGQMDDIYQINLRPDLWYNDVDGIRIGTIFSGRMARAGEEGSHRLDLGVWLGTWFPSLPLSYDLVFTEPVPALSGYEAEFNIQLFSSIREGYHSHGLAVNKRWQDGFDYLIYWEVGFSYDLERRFNHEYTLFPDLWSDSWKGLIKPSLSHQHLNRLGFFDLDLFSRLNTVDNQFHTLSLSISQQILFGGYWEMRIRGHGEIAGDNAYPEYLLLRSSGPEITTLRSSLSRAKGTIPPGWIRDGLVHFAGGANLRGYANRDLQSLRSGETPLLYQSIAAVNLEVDIPNPLQSVLRGIEYISEFLSFRSYIFTDAASAGGHAESEMNDLFANAGGGVALTLNIPDHLGHPRGFVIRYEVPFWLSDPGQESSWRWRHLIGFGATIRF